MLVLSSPILGCFEKSLQVRGKHSEREVEYMTMYAIGLKTFHLRLLVQVFAAAWENIWLELNKLRGRLISCLNLTQLLRLGGGRATRPAEKIPADQ